MKKYGTAFKFACLILNLLIANNNNNTRELFHLTK